MKFLCEHCKAKYQIADDKVAGRTVRMKCRKCGNPIEVRAAVTETSTSARAPQEPSPGASAGHPQNPGAAQQSGVPQRAQGAGSSASAPKTGGLATSLSTSARPTRPPGTGPRSQDIAAQGVGYLQRAPKDEVDHSAGLDLRELSAADEWYVAINGVPVGPVRVAELRRKAALSVVTEDSLCWQEGMEEWRPVRAVTELAAVVREAAAGGRVSLMTSPAPPEGRASAPPPRPAPRASQPAPAPAPPRAPQAPARPSSAGLVGGHPQAPGYGQQPMPQAQPQQAVARSNVVPFSAAGRLATAERLEPEAPVAAAMAPMISPDPFALPSPALAPPQASPFAAIGALAQVPQAQPMAPAVLPPIVSPEAQRRPVPWILLAMFVLAGAFGVTAALLVFKQQPPQVVVVPQQVAAPPLTATAAPAVVGADIPSAAPVDSSASVPASSASVKPAAVAVRNPSSSGGSHPGGAATTTAATDPALQDLIRQTGSGPVSGPAPVAATAGGGGAQMTEGQITSVVMQHQQGVKRTCWERSSGTTPSANVQVQITVSTTGAVQSAQATGNDPVVAHCIENEVRGWKFPSGSSVPIVIPFHFVRQ